MFWKTSSAPGCSGPCTARAQAARHGAAALEEARSPTPAETEVSSGPRRARRPNLPSIWDRSSCSVMICQGPEMNRAWRRCERLGHVRSLRLALRGQALWKLLSVIRDRPDRIRAFEEVKTSVLNDVATGRVEERHPLWSSLLCRLIPYGSRPKDAWARPPSGRPTSAAGRCMPASGRVRAIESARVSK